MGSSHPLLSKAERFVQVFLVDPGIVTIPSEVAVLTERLALNFSDVDSAAKEGERERIAAWIGGLPIDAADELSQASTDVRMSVVHTLAYIARKVKSGSFTWP